MTLGPSPYQGGIALGHISYVGSLIPVLRVGAVIYIHQTNSTEIPLQTSN
jgi:hypothetical protein